MRRLDRRIEGGTRKMAVGIGRGSLNRKWSTSRHAWLLCYAVVVGGLGGCDLGHPSRGVADFDISRGPRGESLKEYWHRIHVDGIADNTPESFFLGWYCTYYLDPDGRALLHGVVLAGDFSMKGEKSGGIGDGYQEAAKMIYAAQPVFMGYFREGKPWGYWTMFDEKGCPSELRSPEYFTIPTWSKGWCCITHREPWFAGLLPRSAAQEEDSGGSGGAEENELFPEREGGGK
jgi:hypothetical protein